MSVRLRKNETPRKSKRNMKVIRSLIAILTAGLLGSTAGQAALVSVSNDITGTVNWTADNEYLLETVIYVQSNAVLNIEAGTVVRGAENVTVGRTDIPSLVSALWVTRGGTLNAMGTKEAPIIFTAESDDLSDPDDVPPTQTALWGGIVLLGNAQLNTAKDVAGNAATPKYDIYEGTEGPGPNGEHIFGGDDDSDSSGTIRYVSIRHAGNEFAPASELNAMTLGGVGKGTTLEYIEVFAGSDDGFEWWGGCVNSSHLIAAFIEDDDFDTDQGYRGTNQFWFGIKPPSGGTGDSRGIESDGDLNQSASGEAPISQWAVYNMTLIGRGLTDGGFGGGIAWNLRDEAAPNVINSVITEFNQGLRLDSDGLLNVDNGLGNALNNIWNVTTDADANGQIFFTDGARMNTSEDPLIGGVSYVNDGGLNPRPLPGSPALGGVLSGAPMAVNYRGAFSGPADNWADGWTALASLGFLSAGDPCGTSPILSVVQAGGSVEITFMTSIGCSYQVRSTGEIAATPIVWSSVGSAIAGTGEAVTVSIAVVPGAEYFTVEVE